MSRYEPTYKTAWRVKWSWRAERAFRGQSSRSTAVGMGGDNVAAGPVPGVHSRSLDDCPSIFRNRTMRISHEAICQALYIEDRGGLHRELIACLLAGRTLRVPRARRARQSRPFVAPEVMLDKRPAEVADRAVPGHWEGDLILGLSSSAIGNLVERSTRFTLLLHLPRLPNHGVEARVKNGPALAGYGAEAVREAIIRIPDDQLYIVTPLTP